MIVQECGAGLVPVKRDGERLAFAAPPRVKEGPVDPSTVEKVASWLGIARRDIVDAQWVDNGPGWVAVVLPSVDAVLDVATGRARAEGRCRGQVPGWFTGRHRAPCLLLG